MHKGDQQIFVESKGLPLQASSHSQNYYSAISMIKTRQKLIEVARELFAQKGVDATTMNDIATASNKGRRTLYTYFRNKEDIFYAVIEDELAHLSKELGKVSKLNLTPEKKIVMLIYTHLKLVQDVVQRNGTLRAKFFTDITMVERVRRKFDFEELQAIRQILQEGIEQGKFLVENVNLTADVIHYAVKGIEVPFMFNWVGRGLSTEESIGIVERLISRALGVQL